MSAYSAQPIQRLKLQRETNVDLNTAARLGAVTKVQGDTLMVAAPQQFEPAGKSAAPKVIKTKIAQDQLETGWSGVANEKERSELQAKMKKEDRKSIPPPDIKPTNPADLNAASTAPRAPAAPRTAGTPSSLALSPDGTPVPDEPPNGKENGDKNRGTKGQSPATKVSSVPDATPVSRKDAGKNKRGKQANTSQAATVESNASARFGSAGNQADTQQAPAQMKVPSEQAVAANGNKHGHGNQKKAQAPTQALPPQTAAGYGRQNAPGQSAHEKAGHGQQGGKEKKGKKDQKGDEPPPQ